MTRLTTLALDLGGNHVVAAGADALAAALRGTAEILTYFGVKNGV